MWANGITPGTAHRFLLEIFFARNDFRFVWVFFSTHDSTTVVPVGKAGKDGAEYLKKGANLHSERQITESQNGWGWKGPLSVI